MRLSLRGGRRVGSSRPAPGVRIQSGGLLAHPETLSPAPASPARDAPPLAGTASRGAPGPTSRSAAPSARAPAPPRRPFALSLPLPFLGGALSLAPGSVPPSPAHAPWPLPRRVPTVSSPAVSAAPAPWVLTPPAWPGQPGTPKPEVSGLVTLTLHFGGPLQEKWQGICFALSEKVLKCKKFLALLFHFIFLYVDVHKEL